MRCLMLLGLATIVAQASCMAPPTQHQHQDSRYAEYGDQDGRQHTKNADSDKPLDIEPAKLELVDGSNLKRVQASLERESIGEEHMAVRLEASLADGTEYVEFYICSREDPDKCNPTRDDPGVFVLETHTFYNPPAGEIVAHMRPCVRPHRAEDPNDNCSEWSTTTPLVAPENKNQEVGELLAESYSKDTQVRAKCREFHEKVSDFLGEWEDDIDDRGLRTLLQNIVVSGEDACAEAMLNNLHVDFNLMMTELQREDSEARSQGREDEGGLELTLPEVDKDSAITISVGLAAGTMIGIGGILLAKGIYDSLHRNGYLPTRADKKAGLGRKEIAEKRRSMKENDKIKKAGSTPQTAASKARTSQAYAKAKKTKFGGAILKNKTAIGGAILMAAGIGVGVASGNGAFTLASSYESDLKKLMNDIARIYNDIEEILDQGDDAFLKVVDANSR